MFRSIMTLLPVGIGLTVMAGWLLDLPVLERVGMPFVTMNPMTAVGVIICGLSLTILQHARTKEMARLISLLLAAFAMIIGLMKLSDLILHTAWHIDTQMFREQMQRAGSKNMAPNAAFDFLLLSTAIMLAFLDSKASRVVSQMLAILCGFIAFLAIIGYTYGTIPFYGIGSFTPMALHSAACFTLLCVGVLSLNAHQGIMTCINNRGPAGRMACLFLPAAMIIPVGIGGLNLVAISSKLYTVEFGNSVFVIMTVAVLFVLTWIGAHWLYSEDLLRRKAEEELRYRASHDRLTGLANRGVFFDMLQQRINVMKRRGGTDFAVFYLDLDGFKQINDRLGHEAGDQLLVEVARIFVCCTRSTDTVARMGGDEFTILFEEIKSPGDVDLLAQRILAAMPRTFGTEESYPVSVSIGIAYSKPEHQVSEDILREADAALYKAKHAGKACYQVDRGPEVVPELAV